MNMGTDVLVVGTGVAGLYCALNLRADLNILMVTKGELTECNSYLAQGGIAVALNQDDVLPFMEDTMRAGNYKNDQRIVEILCQESQGNISQLVDFGVPFNRSNGALCHTKEGAHSKARIVYCEDTTGKHVVDTLLHQAQQRKNISFMEHARVVDIIAKDNVCAGAVIMQDQKQLNIFCKVVIFATGGIGGLFQNSTNERSITGDGLFIALKHNITLKDVSYIQFHPTALYEENNSSRRFLISESVRGEGGKLYNSKGERFVDELLPRDVVSQAIQKEINSSGIPYVSLDISHLSSDYIKNRFPAIYKECMSHGIDITKSPIPVSPAQHYFMGGIAVNEFCQTSMKNFYAVGETSCTGVHGSNRLASNSLLEGLVFSKKATGIINAQIDSIEVQVSEVPVLTESLKSIGDFQRKTVIQEIQRRSPLLNDQLFDYGQDHMECTAGGHELG